MVHCRPLNSLLLLRPLLNHLLSLLFSCTLWLFNNNRWRSFRMVSLPLSFLSLAWASTVDYEVLHSDGHFRVKDKVLIFSTHLFILSIRLFAVALFTVSYKWWVTSVLILHCTVITICDRVWLCRGRGRNEWEQLWEVFKSFFTGFIAATRWFFNTSKFRRRRKQKGIFKKNAVVLQRAVCDRKHHYYPVVLFHSFPSHLVLLTSHYLRLFVCCSRGNNETYSLQLLKEEIRWSPIREYATIICT